MSSRAFTAVGLPIMGGNSTAGELFNLNDLRVELLQSESPHRMVQGEARGLLLFVSTRNSRCLAALGMTGAFFRWRPRPILPTP